MASDRFSEFGPLPEIAGTFKGDVIVCGSGHTLWEDLKRLEGLKADLLTINYATLFVPGARHAYSDHYEVIYPFKLLKSVGQMRDSDLMFHSSTDNGHIDHVWPWPRHGTSSLGGVYTALCLYDGTVHVCGVPLDNGPHFYDPPWGITNYAKQCPDGPDPGPKYWRTAARTKFDGRVKAYSGRLLEIL